MQPLMHWLEESDYLLLDYAALTLLLLAAFMVIKMRDLLASAVLFGIFSLLMAIAYMLFDAPDVALTEAAVGAGISTILFIGTISFTGRVQKRTHAGKRAVALIISAIATAALIASTDALPPFASPEAPIHKHVAPYYLAHTQDDIGIPNFVTAILGSYRGYDTLGEVAVIFVAGIGITALLMNQPTIRKTASPVPVSLIPTPLTPAAPTSKPTPKPAKTTSPPRKPAAAKKKPATKAKPRSKSSRKGAKKS